jgi:hypothetical protein
MKNWIVMGLWLVAGTMLGVMVKTVVSNHSAAAQPATSTTASGS